MVSPMEKRIELEMRGKAKNEIIDLNLDNCRVNGIEGLTSDFSALESLSMINVGLQTLKDFPKLGNLKKLDLSDNRISSDLKCLSGCAKLTHLSLSGNKIKDIDALKPLQDLANLKSLDLFNCEVTSQDDYRETVFKLLPQIVYLDGFDAQEKECDDDDEDVEDLDGEGDDDDEVDEDDENEDDDDDDDEEVDGEEDDEEEDDFDPEVDDDEDDLGEDDEEGEEAEENDEENEDDDDEDGEGAQRGQKRKLEEEEDVA